MHHRHSEGLGVCGAPVLDDILCRARVVGRGGGVDSKHGSHIVDEGCEFDAVKNLPVGERVEKKIRVLEK